MNKPLHIKDLKPLKESYQVPNGYFDILIDSINQRKDDKLSTISVNDIEPLKESYKVPNGYADSLIDIINQRKDDKLSTISITDIESLKESYKVPNGYADSLIDTINKRKDDKLLAISVADIEPLKESYKVPNDYFGLLANNIVKRNNIETPIIKLHTNRSLFLGSVSAIACMLLVGIFIIKFAPLNNEKVLTNIGQSELNIPDHEIASLLNERDDEFALTDDEIIELIEHESVKSESTAIIEYLEDEVEAVDDELLESI